MNTAAKAIKKAHKDMDVDQVHDMMDEIGSSTIITSRRASPDLSHVTL